MSIKGKYKVEPIDSFQCKDWLLKKHYAKRSCPIQFSFGLFNLENILVGICVYGNSANRNNMNIGDYKIIELNRLCVNDNLDKNTLSFFVSATLKMLPSPCFVISYADPNNGHHGYIYQATNWLYLGQGNRKDGGTDSGVTAFIKDGKQYHAQSVAKITGGSTSKDEAEKYGFIRTFTPPKHKYIYLLGTKKDIKKMIIALPYKQHSYPKGDNKRYDASYMPTVQIGLF